MTKAFELTDADVPGRRTHSLYAEILTDFLAKGGASMLVRVEDAKPETLRAGLRKAIKDSPAQDVRLVQRGQDTFLVRVTGK